MNHAGPELNSHVILQTNETEEIVTANRLTPKFYPICRKMGDNKILF